MRKNVFLPDGNNKLTFQPEGAAPAASSLKSSYIKNKEKLSKERGTLNTNPQIAKVFCDVVLYVLNKYDDFNSVLEDSLRLYFFKKNGRLTKREKDKIKMTPSRLSDDNWLTLLCFNRIVISVYKQLRISDTRCDSDIKHPYGWEGFSIVNFDEFLKEAIEKYIGCCK